MYEGASDNNFVYFTQNKELKDLPSLVQMRLQLMSHFFRTVPAEIGALFILRYERFYSLLVPKFAPCCQLLHHNCLHLAIAFLFVVNEVLFFRLDAEDSVAAAISI